MAIFNVKLCGSESFYDVDIDNANIGEIWYFIDTNPERPQNLCGEIIEPSSAESTDFSGITAYTDCYQCLSSIEGALYEFKICNTDETFTYITPSDFGSLPIIDDVFYLTVDSRGVIASECVFFSGIEYDSQNEPRTFISSTPYSDCEDCLFFNTPRSGNTEVFICEQICTESGTTVVSVAPPHPVWTDGYGTSVTQLNMITIGGNGLNS